MRRCHSSFRITALATLYVAAATSQPGRVLALEEAAAAKPAETIVSKSKDKLSLPTAARPIVITITPAFSKALESFKRKAKPKVEDVWPLSDVSAAKARCAAILKKIHAVAVPEPAMKQGACGAPAPVQLISIGSNPQVALSPPATVTCEFAEALEQWIDNDLQPLARRHLGAEIIKIEVMSSYSCRNAYGRKGGKLSEHGLANALDIRGFVTASAQRTAVLGDWGKPQREIVAEIAIAKAAAEKEAAKIAKAEKDAQLNQVASRWTAQTVAAPPSAFANSQGAPAAGLAKSSITDGIPKLTVTLPGASPAPTSSLSFAEPDRLGGPMPKHKNTTADHRRFLHEAHAAACKTFHTTLGPEANRAHLNHFHIDMAKRKVDIKICD